MRKTVADPLVEEVRARGAAYTGRLGHDPEAVLADLDKHLREHPEHYVSQTTVVPKVAPGQRQ